MYIILYYISKVKHIKILQLRTGILHQARLEMFSYFSLVDGLQTLDILYDMGI